MRITITVKPNSRREEVLKLTDRSYRVLVKAPPVEGRANESAIAVLADYFSVPKSAIHLVHGARGKKKIMEVGLVPLTGAFKTSVSF